MWKAFQMPQSTTYYIFLFSLHINQFKLLFNHLKFYWTWSCPQQLYLLLTLLQKCRPLTGGGPCALHTPQYGPALHIVHLWYTLLVVALLGAPSITPIPNQVDINVHFIMNINRAIIFSHENFISLFMWTHLSDRFCPEQSFVCRNHNPTRAWAHPSLSD